MDTKTFIPFVQYHCNCSSLNSVNQEQKRTSKNAELADDGKSSSNLSLSSLSQRHSPSNLELPDYLMETRLSIRDVYYYHVMHPPICILCQDSISVRTVMKSGALVVCKMKFYHITAPTVSLRCLQPVSKVNRIDVLEIASSALFVATLLRLWLLKK
ncbi:unnamed protein product [Absidia cylindrospora]